MSDLRRRRAVVVGIAVFLLFDVAALAAVWRLVRARQASADRVAGWTANARLERRAGEPVATRQSGALLAWRLGGGLDAVEVHDILPRDDGGGAWLGTGLGRVHVSTEGRSVAYRNFPEAPREWARSLVRTDRWLGVTLAVGAQDTGAEPVGTFAFDPEQERWERLLGPAGAAVDADQRPASVPRAEPHRPR